MVRAVRLARLFTEREGPLDESIGFIGTGVMGASMAGHLLQAGKRLTVYSRTRSKAQALLDRGAAWADSPADLAKTCDVVFTIVGFPKDVEEVYLGARGLVANMRPGALLVDMTTSRPDLAVRIAKAAAERGGQALDAPVSGGDRGAREATLAIMVGGGAKVFERALPLLQIMGKNIVHQGPAGSGQHCKTCNQIAIACNMIGVCEAMAYARKAGLDPETVLKTIGAGAAASWSLNNLAPRMMKGDFAPGFYVKHFIKDMGIAAEAADQMALDTPGLDLALALYRRLAAQGGEDNGTQALCKLYL